MHRSLRPRFYATDNGDAIAGGNGCGSCGAPIGTPDWGFTPSHRRERALQKPRRPAQGLGRVSFPPLRGTGRRFDRFSARHRSAQSTERIRSRLLGMPRSTRSHPPSRSRRYSAKAQGIPFARSGSVESISWKWRCGAVEFPVWPDPADQGAGRNILALLHGDHSRREVRESALVPPVRMIT